MIFNASSSVVIHRPAASRVSHVRVALRASLSTHSLPITGDVLNQFVHSSERLNRNLTKFISNCGESWANFLSSYIEQSVDQRWTRGWKLLMSEHCWRVGRYLLEFIGNNHRLRSECALDFHCFHSELKWLTIWPATQTIITTRRRIGNEFIVIYFWDRPDAEKLISKQKAHSDESRINREVFA